MPTKMRPVIAASFAFIAMIFACAVVAQPTSIPASNPGPAASSGPAASGPAEVSVMETGDAVALFNKLFLDKLKAANFSSGNNDNIALAGELLATLSNYPNQPALTSVFCDNIIKLVGNDPAGSSIIMEAMELLAQRVPARRLEAMGFVANAINSRYQAAGDDQKYSVGLTLIDSLKELADLQFESGEYSQSVTTLNKAAAIVDKINPSDKEVLQFLITRASEREKTGKQLTGWLAVLQKDPRDRMIRKQIINAYLIDFDQPELAAKYLDISVAEPLQSNVKLAATDLKTVPEKNCLELGEFYRLQAEAAKSVFVKDAMYRRAKACYEHYLIKHGKQDVDYTTADIILKKIIAELQSLAGQVPIAWVDLMKMARLDKDVKGGKWEFKDGKLTATSDKLALITFPAQVIGSYELQVKFERKTDNREVFIVLPIGKAKVGLIFSASGGECSGLAFVQGKRIRQSDYAVRPGKLENNQVYTVDAKVTVNPVKEGDTTPPSGEISIKLDGKDMLLWKGPLSDLTTDLGYEERVSVGIYRVTAAFHSVRIKPSGDLKPVE